MATITAQATGPSSAGSTWVGGIKPAAGDVVVIPVNITVTVDEDSDWGPSPSDTTTLALTVGATNANSSGGLTVAPGKKLIIRGNVQFGRARWEMGAGSTLEFNAALATTPATNYQFKCAGNATSRIVLNGTEANPVAITSAVGGGNASFTAPAGDAVNFDARWTNFTRLGTASLACISIDGPTIASYVENFEHCTWDGCGLIRWLYATARSAGYSFRDCTFKNKLHTDYLMVVGGGTRPTAAREFIRCTFDGLIQAQGNGTTYIDSYFDQAWIPNSGPQYGGGYTGCFFRLVSNSGYNQNGDFDDCFFLFDFWTGQSPLTSGVATGGSLSTLVNAGAGWATNAYQSNQSGGSFVVGITSGTGAGQFRTIVSNTATTLTISPTWRVTPDATSQYAIWSGSGNPHYVNSAPSSIRSGSATAGTTSTLTSSTSLLVADAWAGYTVYFLTGTGAGQTAVVDSNTTSVLTFTAPVAIPADGTTTFALRRTVRMQNPIYEYTGCNGDGDFWLHFDSVNDYLMPGPIGLPNLADNNSGALITLFYAANSAQQPNTVKAHHCTYFTGEQSLSLIEGWVSPALAQELTELRGSLAWSYSDLTYAAFNTGPYLCSTVPSSPNPGTLPQDLGLAPGGADYNGTWGLNAGYYGKGYNINTSNAGAHDLPFNTNPGFVDPTRDFAGWARMMGSTAPTVQGQITDGLSYIKANPALTRSSLNPWIREGFRPTNEAYRTAAHDGTQIGAVPMAWSFSGNGVAGEPVGAGQFEFSWAFQGAGVAGLPAGVGTLAFEWQFAGAGIAAEAVGAGAFATDWVFAGAGFCGEPFGAGVFDWEVPHAVVPDPWKSFIVRRVGYPDPFQSRAKPRI